MVNQSHYLSRRWRLSVLAVALLALVGCTSVSYLGQASAGQLSVWWHRQPIEALLAEPSLPPEPVQQLQRVLAIRAFASRELGLPDNDSYRYYTDIDRPYVVWNVFAAEALSTSPKQWCFPLLGCVNYRGYFAEADAERYRQSLRRQGMDTYVAGVAAYSTLGWFDDPLLSSVIDYDEVRLAALIFHELAHQQLYLAGDTTFNESFATAVEMEGVRRWLQRQGKLDELERYRTDIAMREDFVAMLLNLRQRLATLYQSELEATRKLEAKRSLLQQFARDDYAGFRQRWPRASQYDAWVGDLNNAKLVTVSSYYQWLPAFQLLLDISVDMPAFYRRAASLADLAPEARELALRQLQSEFEK